MKNTHIVYLFVNFTFHFQNHHPTAKLLISKPERYDCCLGVSVDVATASR